MDYHSLYDDTFCEKKPRANIYNTHRAHLNYEEPKQKNQQKQKITRFILTLETLLFYGASLVCRVQQVVIFCIVQKRVKRLYICSLYHHLVLPCGRIRWQKTTFFLAKAC